MKQKLTTLLFSLLLAVGWTSNAFAQSATYKAEDIKTWTYGWRNANGDSIDSKYIDEVTDPYQMYGLLRWIYMDKRFPGPYKSAYKADGITRERDVYYGGMDGGWEIPGTPVSGSSSGTTTITGTATVADGGSTAAGYEHVPVYGYYFETAQTTQTIYTASELSAQGLQVGDKITSLSFYPKSTSLPFSGGNIRVSLGTTTTNSFSTNSALNVSVTQVAQVTSYSMSNGQWTINFSQPFTYTGNNLLVQIDHASGSYGESHTYFYGTEPSQSVYRSYSSYTPSRYTFVPKASFNYERTVTGDVTTGIGDITIIGGEASCIKSITVRSGNTTLLSWSMDNNAINTVPGMYVGTWHFYGNRAIAIPESDPIILQGWLFEGYSSVDVTINAYYNTNYSSGTLNVNGSNKTVTGGGYNNSSNYTWTVNRKTFVGPTMYVNNTYLPNEEGYTALVVKLKNTLNLEEVDDFYDTSLYNTKEEIIEYLRKNVRSIQLLTDGLRIGSGESTGTVFNCPGTSDYNRFFFLGKGQARQKSDMVLKEQIFRQHLLGEEVPFRQMFEQFSPTGGKKGDDIKDFYSKMMKGEVFPVVHDCLSVIQNEHEFSMSGHDGTTAYAMPGMNFFIPDYRLKYWELTDTVTESVWNSSTSKYDKVVKEIKIVDGRDMNPYQPASGTKTNDPSTFYRSPSNLAVWYAQYDTANNPPVVGIYLLTLAAQASQVDNYSAPDNRYYNVDLDWTSSLNEMAGPDPVTGKGVKQTYIIYEVVTDSVTGERRRVAIDTVKNCDDFRPHLRLDTLYKQRAHSYTLTYIIEGSPVDSDHPEFVAWSREASVIIPGYDDFMALKLHHYESDFVIRRAGDEDYNAENGEYDEKNYYRNYLQPENDFLNGITAEDILGGFDSFILYRTSTDGKVPVAKLKLAVDGNGKVLYKITYFDDNENYHSPNFSNAEIQSVINQLLNNQ